MDVYTPWTLLVDVGLVSILLLIGKLLRANVRFIQKMFIPPSLLAGFAALIFGPGVLGWLPLSDKMGTYAGILIALVFSTLPLTSNRKATEGDNLSIRQMWAYSQSGLLLQWALGGILGFLVFGMMFHVNPAFGLAMPAGYCGGHGTAAAIGEAFGKYGVPEMQSLAMTAATVGIIASVVVGMWLISWGSEHGKTTYLSRYSELPPELRTGILPKNKRSSMGLASFSAISLDSMTFNFAIIAVIALGGFGVSKLVEHFWPALMLPVFSCAFLVGLLAKWILKRAKFDEYVSKPIVDHLSGTFTDYLVAFGVASIKLEVVAEFIVPLLILLTVGMILTMFYVFYVGERIHSTCWFEKSIFTWGWFTGTMAMGIALLRITDPEGKSHCLDDYAYAYLYIAPIEISLVTFSPLAFANGWGGLFVAICLVLGSGILVLSKVKGWFVKNEKA